MSVAHVKYRLCIHSTIFEDYNIDIVDVDDIVLILKKKINKFQLIIYMEHKLQLLIDNKTLKLMKCLYKLKYNLANDKKKIFEVKLMATVFT